MRNKSKLVKEIIVQVIVALLIQMILYGSVYIWSCFNKEKINITICASTKKDSGYSTSINIKNFQNDKSISDIVIWTDVHIDSSSLNYKDFEIYDDKIVIKNLPPLYNGTIILYSDKEINEENTRVETQEKRVVRFLYKQEEENSLYFRQIISNIVSGVIVYTIMIIIAYIITNKQIDLYQQKAEQISEQNKNIEKRCKEIEKELELREKEEKERNKAHLKLKIFLNRRLVDYAKELDFYKKIIKNIVNDNCKSGDICYEITKELKTFKTLEKINAEDLEIDSLVLSEIEVEETKKQLQKQ